MNALREFLKQKVISALVAALGIGAGGAVVAPPLLEKAKEVLTRQEQPIDLSAYATKADVAQELAALNEKINLIGELAAATPVDDEPTDIQDWTQASCPQTFLDQYCQRALPDANTE